MAFWDSWFNNNSTPSVENDEVIISIFNKITNFFGDGSFVNGQITNLINILLGIVGAYLTAWILYRAFQILWGKNNDNIKDFMWDTFLKFIFILICFNPDEWLNLVTEAIKEMRDISITGQTLEKELQLFWDICYSIILDMTATDEIFQNPAVAIYNTFCSLIVLLGAFIGVIGLMSVMIINYISFLVLLAITPFAFYCLIFGNFLKPIFKQWWSLILSCVLVYIFLQIFMSFGMNIARGLASASLNTSDMNFLKRGGYVILAGLIIKFVASLITGIVEKIVGVSIEGSIASGIANGLKTAGVVGGAGALFGANFAKGVGKLGNKIASYGLNNTAKGRLLRSKFNNRKSFKLQK